MRIGKRLEKILTLIKPNCGKIIDVGTDHGFLAFKAVTEKNAELVYATDISKDSLDKAVELAKKHSLEDRIIFVLSDGFKNLEGEFDVAVVAGMGGNEIVKILKQCPQTVKVLEYLLQPMQDAEILRGYLLGVGYEIEYDETVLDRNKFYSVIQCRKAEVKNNFSDIDVVVGKTDLENKGQDFKKFLHYNINKLEVRKDFLSEQDRKRLDIYKSFSTK